MKRSVMLAVFCTGLLTTNAHAAEWQYWEVDAVAGTSTIGCGGGEETIDLGDNGHTLVESNETQTFSRVKILARLENDQLQRLKLATPDCLLPQDVVIEKIERNTEESLEWLEAAIQDHANRQLRSEAIMAVAHHAANRATGLLRDYVAASENSLWAPAIFWLPMKRGNEGIAAIAELLRDASADSAKRRDATFSYALAAGEEAVPLLREIIRTDAPIDVRSQAIFAISQTRAAGQERFLHEIAISAQPRKLRQQALFALSVLNTKAGVDVLLEIARDPANGPLRRDALFWLANTDIPAAENELLEILEN